MHTIIVTGATSMIGAALIREALEHQNVEIYAIVRPDSERLCRLPDSPAVHVIESEIGDLSRCNKIPSADVFYHFAWEGTGKRDRDDTRIQERNIQYSLDAVELAYRCGCRSFIGAGSQAEYGIVTDTITEETAADPFLAYGMAKLASCMLCGRSCEQKGIRFIWGRIFSVYGINDNAGTMLDYAIECFRNGSEAVFSAATQMWNYLYETDAGRIFYLLGRVEEASGIYNIANKQSQPLRIYIDTLAKVAEKCLGYAPHYRFREEQAENTVSLKPDVSKLIKTVGDPEMTAFEEGTEKMILSRIRS